jgi:ABC-type sugar transport system ATPase subunit
MEIQSEFLKISHISKTYGVVNALSDVSFSVRRGEIHTVLGENGAGKSTLVKIITGETQPDEDGGFIELDGVRVKSFTPRDAHKMGIYMVHQELAVFENLTVAENIFPDHNFKKSGRIDYKKLYEETKKMLDMFGLRTIRPDAPLASITLAGQQMAEILRCIVAGPKVIILDEPTSGLNDYEADLLMDILKRLKDENMTIIYISHRLKEVMRISDRVTVLRDGKFVTTLENGGALTENDLINSMVGRDLSGSLYKIKTESGARKGEPLLEVKELAKRNVLAGTSFSLAPGEIVGVFGLEGSGTARLSRMIYGLERFDSGEIKVKGRGMNNVLPRFMAREGVMYLNNNRKIAGLLPDMKVTDNISLPILRKLSSRLGFIDFKRLAGVTEDFVKRFAIALPSLAAKPKNLSGGNQQKVMLSVCLVPEPDILIANEPTRGIDVGAKTEIHKFILEIAAKGVGVIIFSSELPELMSLSDRILVMRNGAIAGETRCGSYTEQAIMRQAAVGGTEEVMKNA